MESQCTPLLGSEGGGVNGVPETQLRHQMGGGTSWHQRGHATTTNNSRTTCSAFELLEDARTGRPPADTIGFGNTTERGGPGVSNRAAGESLVHLVQLDNEGMDLVADLVVEEADSEDLLDQHGRTVTSYIHILQWTMACLLSLFAVFLVAAYMPTWDVECDRVCKMWSLVWLTRFLFQLMNNIYITQLKLRRERIPLCLLVLVRIVHVIGCAWVFLGIYVIYYIPRCKAETLAFMACKVMVWMTVVLYTLPFALYLLLLLCLPLLIFLMVRYTVPPADRHPTPPDVLNQLEVKTYRDIVNSLRTEYDVAPTYSPGIARTMPSLSTVLDNVTALLSSASLPQTSSSTLAHSTSAANLAPTTAATQLVTADASASTHAADSVAVGDRRRRADDRTRFAELDQVVVRDEEASVRHTASSSTNAAAGSKEVNFASTRLSRSDTNVSPSRETNGLLGAEEGALPMEEDATALHRRGAGRGEMVLTCPICMVDLDDDDEVMLMPCDSRHFFHKTCVEQWLERSQACPICRANIVNILTGAGSSSVHGDENSAASAPTVLSVGDRGSGSSATVTIEMRVRAN